LSPLPAQLPDGALLRRIAAVLVEAVPADWTTLEFALQWTAPDTGTARFWTTDTAGRRVEGRPPPAHGLVHVLRARQTAAGHDPWERCELRLTRAGGAQRYHLTARFGFGTG